MSRSQRGGLSCPQLSVQADRGRQIGPAAAVNSGFRNSWAPGGVLLNVSRDEEAPLDPFLMAEVTARIHDALVADELDSMDGPHVVMCNVVGTDIVSIIGPFRTGLAALMHAEAEARRSTKDQGLEYCVASLWPPSEPE